MRLFLPRIRRLGAAAGQPAPPRRVFGTDAEDPVVRQYRFLLRTAPLDALEAAHAEALPGLEEPVRVAVLRVAQDNLLAGIRLGPDDTGALAHLLAFGERRVPGAVLGACDETVLQELAQAVIDTEAVFGLFSGYAVWDGAEPGQPPVEDETAGHDESWQRGRARPPMYRGLAGPIGPDIWGGGWL